jgi:hypothetical protein
MAHTILCFSSPLRALSSPLPSSFLPSSASSTSSASPSPPFFSSSRSSRLHAKFQRFEQGQEEAEYQEAKTRAENNGSALSTIGARELGPGPELPAQDDEKLAEDR